MPKINLLMSITLIMVAIFGVIGYWDYFVERYPNHCNMTFMDPTFIPLSLKNVSRFEHKYKIFYYREGIFHKPPNAPKGVPIIFVPGHAGDHTQVRSLASVSARITTNEERLQKLVDRGIKVWRGGHNELDWFSINVNEEWSALSGRLLFDQAEFLNDCIGYVLALYDHLPVKQRPQTVILVGHSMGGVVSRAALAMDNYKPESVNTIFTISSPHRATLLSHPSVYDFYKKANDYWRTQNENSTSDVHNISILSIAGGLRDTLIRSELCNLEPIADPDHQLSTLSTSVPDVWLSVDHIASTWCNQLALKISRALHDLVDNNTKQATLPSKERMSILKKYFTSFIPNVLGLIPRTQIETLELVSPNKDIYTENIDTIREIGSNILKNSYSWDLPLKQNESISIITDISKEKLSILLCSENQSSELCIDATKQPSLFVPFPFKIEILGRYSTQFFSANMFKISSDDIVVEYSKMNFTKIYVQKSKETKNLNSFLIGSLYNHSENEYIVHPPLLSEWKKNLDVGHAPITRLRFGSVNKFHVMNVKAINIVCPKDTVFSPVFMQYTMGMREERWRQGEIDLRWHELGNTSEYASDVDVFIFSDPECTFEVVVVWNFIESVAHIFRNYFMLAFAPPFSLALIAYAIQIQSWRTKGTFQSMLEVLVGLLNKVWPFLFVIIIVSIGLEAANKRSRVDEILDMFFTSISVTGHSFAKMLKPWPSVYFVTILNWLSFGTLWLASYFCYFILKIPAPLLGWIYQEKVELDPVSNGTQSILTRILRFVVYIVLTSLVLLHHLNVWNINEAIPMILSIVYFIFFFPRRYKSEVLFNYDHSLLVIYAMVLGLVFPDFLIYWKDRSYNAQPYHENAWMALSMITHLCFSENFLAISKPNVDVFACILLAIGIQLYCLYPIYRIINMMSFFLLLNVPFLIRPTNPSGNAKKKT